MLAVLKAPQVSGNVLSASSSERSSSHRGLGSRRLQARLHFQGTLRRNVVASASGNWASAFPAELPLASEGGAARELNSVSDFTRFFDNGDEGAELQTAVVSYFSRKAFPWSLFQPELQVDLVAAVHIADKEYFAVTQRELDAYDCVLYELVADKGKEKIAGHWKPPNQKSQRKRKRNFSFIGAVQRLMAQLLTLDFQLECMDYQKDNWYHADLDFETFKELQRSRGESLFGFATELTKISTAALSAAALKRPDLDQWKGKLLWISRVFPMPLVGLLVIEGVCAPANAPLRSSQEMKALFNLDFAAAMKLFLAKQLATNLGEGAIALLKDSVIIGERNKVAMRELEVALDEGCEKIAIFYGSGHLPDMDSSLRKLGFRAERIKWQTAWSIQGRNRMLNRRQGDSLEAAAKITGWPLNRYQTVALLLFSLVLALDLCFWEVCFESLNNSGNQLIKAVAAFLDTGWNL